MNNICKSCKNEYVKKKHHRSGLCDSCYAIKRKEDNRLSKERERIKNKPLIKRIDALMIPHVYNLNIAGYYVLDASGSSITFQQDYYFETIPDGWMQYMENNILNLFVVEKRKSISNLSKWIYYDIQFKDIK